MKTLSGKEFIRLLEKNGWTLRKVNGSHHILTKEGNIEKISVPVHSNKALKKGLQIFLMKKAGINEEDLSS
jgi:predicted RNA binding protein YcfA (HicA-like mRNA interferase family)